MQYNISSYKVLSDHDMNSRQKVNYSDHGLNNRSFGDRTNLDHLNMDQPVIQNPAKNATLCFFNAKGRFTLNKFRWFRASRSSSALLPRFQTQLRRCTSSNLGQSFLSESTLFEPRWSSWSFWRRQCSSSGMSPTCEGPTPPADFQHSGCIFEGRISTLDVGWARLDIRLKWPEKNVVI